MPVLELLFSGAGQTRMQSLNPDPKAQYTSIYGALKKIMKTEGFWRPLRGLNVMMMGAGPAHAMYFACYENMKRTLNDVFNHQGNSHLANGIAGSMATLLHDAVMNPAEVVKQRLQMFNSKHRPSTSSPTSSCRSRSTLAGTTTRSLTSSRAGWRGPWPRPPPLRWTSVRPCSTLRRTWHCPWPRSVAGSQAWPMPSGPCTSSTASRGTSRASRHASSTRCPPRPSPGPSMSSSSTSSPSASWRVELHTKAAGCGKLIQHLLFAVGFLWLPGPLVLTPGPVPQGTCARPSAPGVLGRGEDRMAAAPKVVPRDMQVAVDSKDRGRGPRSEEWLLSPKRNVSVSFQGP
ncbi:mitoferrin-1 isoform 2-T2 [Thomomys bottae]